MSYEILLEEREPIDGWMVCTVCLNVDRTTNVLRRRWRCADCGVDTSNNSQRALRDYLTENGAATIEKNLQEWSNVKGVRAAYKMLRSAEVAGAERLTRCCDRPAINACWCSSGA